MGSFEPTIPRDSIILVTGANGLIASHAVDQLLAAGYRVRGTVRDLSRCSWLVPLFEKRHGAGRLELVQVSDLGAAGAWDKALRGVSGVAAVAGAGGLDVQDIDAQLDGEWPGVVGLLQAAKDEPSVKAVAYTSSAWAVWTPDASKKRKLEEWTFNQEAVDIARSDQPREAKGLHMYAGFKTILEEKIWEWVRAEKPSYTFNAVLPDTVIGPTLDPRNQGIQSTCGFVKMLWDGVNLHLHAMLQPQWFVDTRDVGALYVAALIIPGVNGERLFGFGDRYSWPQVRQILQELYPQKEIPELADQGRDQTDVPNKRAEELLRKLGRKGWTSLEEGVKACAEDIVSLE
ncbi:NAD(P)-binding protein [Xylariaceae sp. FL0016]|nr:NAD(P)-binding protein [Xylariaceae sp. FL0016]